MTLTPYHILSLLLGCFSLFVFTGANSTNPVNGLKVVVVLEGHGLGKQNNNSDIQSMYHLLYVRLYIVCKEIFCAQFEVLKRYMMISSVESRYKLI